MERAQLLADLVQGYDESELAGLCLRLGLQLRDINGSTNWDKMRSLIKEAEAKSLIPQLIEEMVSDRPELAESYLDEDVLSWIDRVLPEESTLVEELPTLKWPDSQQGHSADETNKMVKHKGVNARETPTMTWPDKRQMAKKGDLTAEGDAQTPQFVDREMERDRLAQFLMRAESCAVIGAPLIGKSALLNYICEYQDFPPELKILFANLDLRLEHFHTVNGLHNGALSSWYGQLMDAPPPIAPTAADFSRQIRTLYSAGFRPVLCLDGFEHLLALPTEFNDELFTSWWRLTQTGQLTFLTSLERPLADLMKSQGLVSRFPQAIHYVGLGLIDELAARKLLVDTASSGDVVLPSTWVKALLALCGRHPYYLRMAAGIARKELLTGTSELEAVGQNLRRQVASSWDRLWEALSVRQRSLLTIPFPEDPPLVIARQYQRLAKLGLVVEEEGRFRPFSQLFTEWLSDRS